MRKFFLIIFGVLFFAIGCSSESIAAEEVVYNSVDNEDITVDSLGLNGSYKILSLGDSYTIGQSVCNTCRFPEQLKQKILSGFSDVKTIDLKIVARTGWTTTNLLNSLSSQEIGMDYDFVTLLIGVNNQYQGISLEVYKKEFPELVAKAITYANGDINHVVVLSIPDYAYTPFGQGDSTISEEILDYNQFAKNYCEANGITFLNITDITQQGLNNPALVANDDLHPSALSYEKFVKRLLPLFIEKMKD
ncbi:lysophospholipase [Wenyingzhuangia fucanilytica]|uniref:Lysophospholipase n=1 Tax=Wenyingzhuangia fucanilytica TaxID=1790137 RepID=A0A1B1Y961_9FLAO|nr:SGNH/GDSL hydrolase family protein [Wenyingzhuangia fucanilytica]ANW97320.1 lysophospholipase [Wenyingzhuangia fucanilytica]